LSAFTIKRIYNNRLGISRKDDVLAPRITNFPPDDGRSKDDYVASTISQGFKHNCYIFSHLNQTPKNRDSEQPFNLFRRNLIEGLDYFARLKTHLKTG
jgi:hypothetical protein